MLDSWSVGFLCWRVIVLIHTFIFKSVLCLSRNNHFIIVSLLVQVILTVWYWLLVNCLIHHYSVLQVMILLRVIQRFRAWFLRNRMTVSWLNLTVCTSLLRLKLLVVIWWYFLGLVSEIWNCLIIMWVPLAFSNTNLLLKLL